MTEYIIYRADSTFDLSLLVKDKINEGWQVQGGPFVSGLFKQTFHQAMTKEPIREKEPESVPFKSRSKN